MKIPNNEVRNEYVNSVAASDWGEVSIALKQSADTLNAIWQKRPQQVAEGAIHQFKDKEYCRSLEEYKGNILLVGVTYNKKTKEHKCVIEDACM